MWYKAGLALLLASIYLALLVIALNVGNYWGGLLMFSFLLALLGFAIMLGSARGGKTDKSSNNSDNKSKE